MDAQITIPPCPVCNTPRVVRTSHTAKNPDRVFITCPRRCEGSFKWVDTLPKYDFVRPMVKTDAERKERLDKRMQDFNNKIEAPASLGVFSFSSEASEKSTNDVGENIPIGAGAVQPQVASEIVSEETKSPAPLSFLKIPAPTLVVKKDLVWSEYQENIFKFVAEDAGHGVVIARAGAAKTTSGIECLNRTPKSADSAFVAFGTDVVATLKERAPSHAYVSTVHAMCYENARNQIKGLKFNEYKLHNLWDDEIDLFGKHYELKLSILKLVNGLKATLRKPVPEDLDYLIDRYGIEVNGDTEIAYELTEKLYRASLAHKEELDFEDMIFWCAIGEIECQKFDYIYGDEFQDMTYAQTRVLKNSLKPNGRIIVLGDPAQSLYGFRFADTDAMDNAIKEYDATTLPLPVSYRCPLSVIRLAQTLVPDIQARPDAPEGKVETIPSLVGLHEGDVVLCRMNRFLVAPCFDLIRKERKASILGRDIGNNLSALLQRGQKKTRSSNLREILYALDQYVSQESAKYIKARKEAQAESLQDRLETLRAIAERCQDLGEVKRRINTIFTKEKRGVVFSTVHKYKGQESDRVFIIQPQLLEPQKFDQQAWQLEQLKNTKYVGYTRAKEELYFVQ